MADPPAESATLQEQLALMLGRQEQFLRDHQALLDEQRTMLVELRALRAALGIVIDTSRRTLEAFAATQRTPGAGRGSRRDGPAPE